jgi:anti-sigma factor (TIGR02949 family)
MRDRSECEAVVRQMWSYLDFAVSDAEHATVAAHLDACADCASHFDFAAEFLRALAASVDLSPTDERLRQRVIGALAAEGFEDRAR